MAMYSFPFVSQNGDRKVLASQERARMRGLITNGVWGTHDINIKSDYGPFQVYQNSGMTVNINVGRAHINGVFCNNDEVIVKDIQPASPTLNRIDAVVLRLDETNREITVEIVSGTHAANAIPPAITRTATVYEIILAYINVNKGITSITQNMITDTRLDTSVCGIVTQMVQSVDTSALYAQIQSDLTELKSQQQADFFDWLDDLQDVLDDNTAGNLYNLITATQEQAKTIPIYNANATYDDETNTINLELINAPNTLPANYTVNFTAPTNAKTGAKISIANIEHIVNLYGNGQVLADDDFIVGQPVLVNINSSGAFLVTVNNFKNLGNTMSPDNLKNNGKYAIINRTEMPTVDTYVIDVTRCAETMIKQEATLYSNDSRRGVKFERFWNGATWSTWTCCAGKYILWSGSSYTPFTITVPLLKYFNGLYIRISGGSSVLIKRAISENSTYDATWWTGITGGSTSNGDMYVYPVSARANYATNTVDIEGRLYNLKNNAHSAIQITDIYGCSAGGNF